MKTNAILLLILGLFLSGCDEVSYVRSAPELAGFYVVDSHGLSTEFSSRTSRIDPYIDHGVFEAYWYVNSHNDYRVTLSINDRPSLISAVILSTEVCGWHHSCDQSGLHMCEYTTHFELGCGIDLHEAWYNLTVIDDLFWSVPDTLYLNAEVCDLAGYRCEVRSVPVRMY